MNILGLVRRSEDASVGQGNAPVALCEINRADRHVPTDSLNRGQQKTQERRDGCH